MLSNELQSRLISFYDLDREEYRECHGYVDIEEDVYLNIKDTAKQAIETISSFSDADGYVAVDASNVVMLWKCIDALNICMHHRTSWQRESTVLLIYQFLRNFRWKGDAPKYTGYDGWGPLIYTLLPEQLSYYLWWRDEAKKGIFHEATGEYLWLYIYDVVLNTCYDDPNQSLVALQNLYDSYERLSPVVTKKRLSHKRLGYFIVNYAIYNGLNVDINSLIKTYGVDDKFSIYRRIENGCFEGTEKHLLSLAYSASKTNIYEYPDEKNFTLSILAQVFEQISKICKEVAVNFLGDMCGILSDHSLWSPYDSSVLYALSAAKTVSPDKHISFAIGENPYIYAVEDDLSSDPELVNNRYSFYYNDDGTTFHCKGFYYRKKYSGPNETARKMIDYIIRKIQIEYRSLFGGDTIKELIFPYKEIKSKVDHIIHSLVQQRYPVWEKNKESATSTIETQYTVLAEDQISVPLRFKYKREISKSKEKYKQKEKNKQEKEVNSMSKTKKVKLLKERFDILKNQFSENENSGVFHTLSQKIIVPMLELDFDEGCKMWEYLLSYYYDKCSALYYHSLIEDVLEYSKTEVLIKVFRSNETIKKYVFLLNPDVSGSDIDWFLGDLVLLEEYDLANELLTLNLQNDHGENKPDKNLYSILLHIVDNSETKWKITSEGIDFLNQWIKKVKSKTNRAQLEVSLLSLIDCVENGAPKGSMPLSMFMEEDGLQLLLDDNLKKKNMQDKQESFSEVIETRKKSTKSSSTAVKTKDKQQEKIQPTEMFDKVELEDSLKELNALIGLQEVKAEIKSLTNLMRIRRIRAERGMKVPDTSQHLVFTGNPGTGKTTVARIISKVYHALGFLSKGHLVEVDRSGLVAGYVGQTAIKTQGVIQSALGGILFIDEAYTLSPERSENDFGQEAIDTILKAMEDHRDDFVVIVAGYDNLMPRFIESNPGLKSRFNKYIFFPDYNGENLFSIFKMFLEKNDYVIDDDAAGFVAEYLENLYQNRDENFGNARDVRNLFEKMISNQANRLVNTDQLSDDTIRRITIEDIQNVV